MAWERDRINAQLQEVRARIQRYKKSDPEKEELVNIYENLEIIYDLLYRFCKKR